MIGGDGIQGGMVHGNPLNETIVFNHEKLWVPAQPVKPDVPDMTEVMAKARELAKEEKWKPAASMVFKGLGKGNKKLFPEEALIRPGPRFGLNYVHPALHLKIKHPESGKVTDYRRTLELDNGEVKTFWSDNRGDWQRSVFVSRPDNVIVTRLTRPHKGELEAEIQFHERPGYDTKDIAPPSISHQVKDGVGELYLHTSYRHLHGLSEAEGYHVMARVVTKGSVVGQGCGRSIDPQSNRVFAQGRTA